MTYDEAIDKLNNSKNFADECEVIVAFGIKSYNSICLDCIHDDGCPFRDDVVKECQFFDDGKDKSIRITDIDSSSITFSDGTVLSAFHDQDCFESNWAAFDTLRNITDDPGYIFSIDFFHPLQIERCDCGFRFGNDGNMFFVPCYSRQNGYYSTAIDISINGKEVLTAYGTLIGC